MAEAIEPADPAGWPVLPRAFLDRPVLTVAPALLGVVLAHQTTEGLVAAQIVEVEAYRGQSDPASHAFRGRSPRNEVMFGPPGHAYVYFTYGMHYCVNLVCQRPGEADAVLLRAGRVVEGAALAASRRRLAAGSAAAGAAARSLARGPARLCQALAIARSQNGADVCDQDSPLRVLAPAGFAGQDLDAISSGPRVGVRLGAEEPWRFWLTGEAAVSPYRPYVPKRRSPRALSIVTSWPAGGRMQPWATSSTS